MQVASTAGSRPRRKRLIRARRLQIEERKRCDDCTYAFKELLSVSEEDQPAATFTRTKASTQPEFVNRKVILHNTFKRLEHSASQGCSSCQIIYQIIYATRPNDEYPLDSPNPVRLTLERDNRRAEACYLHHLRRVWLFRIPDPDQLGERDYLATPLLLEQSIPYRFDESAEDTFALLGKWLETCDREHSECLIKNHDVKATSSNGADVDGSTRPTSEAFLPTRLLKIKRGECGIEVRLWVSSSIETSNCGSQLPASASKPFRYSTLSYCWGSGTDHFTTTKDNYESHLRGINLQALPKTFRDAIVISSKLGCDYIWIDALCIIQPTNDDTRDWDIEAGQMCQIYQNSYVTIAATRESHVEGGCFGERAPMKFQPRPHNVDDLLDHSVAHQYGAEARLWINPEPVSYSRSVKSGPLAQRGWTLQEELLSPRCIFVARDGIFWKCQTITASEIQPKGEEVREIRNSDQQFGCTRTEWRRIIEDFALRKLTNLNDRLPALSGIIHQLTSQNQEDNYFAGIFRETAQRNLCWRSVQHTPSTAKLSRRLPGPPSWSWASVPTTFSYDPVCDDRGCRSLQVFDFRVLQAEVYPAGPDPYGRVDGGRIRLRGKVVSVPVIETEPVATIPGAFRILYLGRWDVDRSWAMKLVSSNCILYLDVAEAAGWLDKELGASSYLQCLLIGRHYKKPSRFGTVEFDLDEDDVQYHLVLNWISYNVYERVGLMVQRRGNKEALFRGETLRNRAAPSRSYYGANDWEHLEMEIVLI